MKNAVTDCGVLFVTSFPPRECGIATYSKDLIDALRKGFHESLNIRVCALVRGNPSTYQAPPEVKYVLDTTKLEDYSSLAEQVNEDEDLNSIMIQHEFGLFGGDYGEYLLTFLQQVTKPVFVTLHTVLPNPDPKRLDIMKSIAERSRKLVVLTSRAATLLKNDYGVPDEKIVVIPHGTHAIEASDKQKVKQKYGLEGKILLSSFGLLSPNKSIETAIKALPAIVKEQPNVLYIVLGKTHPEVVKEYGDVYRESLVELAASLGVKEHVLFVNKYLELKALLEYLKLTDIYLFTSRDPHQAVSGTFAYAMASGCPIVATPIPHALEMLGNDTGAFFDFGNSEQLAEAVLRLVKDTPLREQMGLNAFAKTRPTIWENVAISHAQMLHEEFEEVFPLKYNMPPIRLDHLQKMTTPFGIIQFSKIGEPDPETGYTLDDNARALIVMCMHYQLERNAGDLDLIDVYLSFIEYCQLDEGHFLNYVDYDCNFMARNQDENLEDSNGRAIWALGTLLAYQEILPMAFARRAEACLRKAIVHVDAFQSPRAIAFAIRGLYYYHRTASEPAIVAQIDRLAAKLAAGCVAASVGDWNWFEEYMTYANGQLPEALLYAFMATGKPEYMATAQRTFDFLLSQLFRNQQVRVISNQLWLHRDRRDEGYGEQPIEVAGLIVALELFWKVSKLPDYRERMDMAFSWFLGNNHLGQMIYNSTAGSCFDGLEKENVNLNQGAESTICYLMARLVMERNKPTAMLVKPLGQRRHKKILAVHSPKTGKVQRSATNGHGMAWIPYLNESYRHKLYLSFTGKEIDQKAEDVH